MKSYFIRYSYIIHGVKQKDSIILNLEDALLDIILIKNIIRTNRQITGVDILKINPL